MNAKYIRLIKPTLIIMAALITSVVMWAEIFPAAVIWIVALAGLSVIPVTLKGKNGYLFDILALLFIPLFTLYFSQLINIVTHKVYPGTPSLLLYINRLASEGPVFIRIPTEMLLIASFYMLLRLVRVPRKVASLITPVPFLLLALVDFYVFNFRGSEIIFSDLYGAGTAFNVAAGYDFPMKLPFFGLIMPYVFLITSVINIKVSCKDKDHKLLDIIVCASASAVLMISFALSFTSFAKSRTCESYLDRASQGNGVTLNFLLSIVKFHLAKPDGYDASFASGLLAESQGAEFNSDNASNIIVIMNESLSDLAVYEDSIGPFSEDPMPFINSLTDNTLRGYAYSSVFGGRTANSEFEYLTGITTYDLPDGYLPYAVTLHHETYSLASYLADNGYRTIAMHPYYGNSWNRDRVYPMLGFEDTVFVTDEEYSYTLPDDQIHSYLTDRNAYENVLSLIDDTDGQKQFIFLVTIQNHGGYSGVLDNLPVINFIGPSVEDYESVNNFLSLVRQSDEAFEYLIGRLSDMNERYTVVMFGDHQPRLEFNSDSASEFESDGWVIPYIIWSNYDNGLDSAPGEYEERPTSINYLSLDTLDAAGIGYSPYFSYINSVREAVPVITHAGFESEGNEDALQDYLSLQYYTLTN